MLKALNADRLRALADEDFKTDYDFIVRNAKLFFKTQCMSQGVLCLFDFFAEFQARLQKHSRRGWTKERGTLEWHIYFRDRPFRHLSVWPDPDRRAFVKIFEDEKHVETFEILDHPEQWQAMMHWIWDYGNDRLIRQAAIQARRKASRGPSTAQIPPDSSFRSNPSNKDPSQKDPQSSIPHRLLRSGCSKAQRGPKCRGMIKPSPLGRLCITLTDVDGEGEVAEGQILQKEDLDEHMAGVSPSEFSANDHPSSKTSGPLPKLAGDEAGSTIISSKLTTDDSAGLNTTTTFSKIPTDDTAEPETTTASSGLVDDGIA